MARIRRFVVSQVEGNDANATQSDEIRPYGEIGLFEGDQINNIIDEDRLELLIFDGTRTHLRSKVLSPGRFYGYDADSGDGEGFDTIKLIPDASLYYNGGDYGNDQYLVVDPTGPNHIHIRAGGNIDQSSADLFLGGELTNVKVSDLDDTVTITTSQVGEGVINRDWVFDNSGILTFPMGGAIEPVGMGWTGLTNGVSGTPLSIVNKSANIDYSGQALADITITNNTDTQGRVYISTSDLVSSQFNAWTFDYDGSLTLPGSSNGRIADDEPGIVVYSENGFAVQANVGGNVQYNWIFGSDGNLTTSSNLVIGPVPGGGSIVSQYDAPLAVISASANAFTYMGWGEFINAPGNVALIGFNSPAVANGAANVSISTGNNAPGGTQYDWVFTNDGTLTLPSISTGASTEENTQIGGTRKVIGKTNTWSSYIAGHSAFGAVAWVASSPAIQSARITFVVQSNGTAFNWEQFDVSVCKMDGANAFVSVSGRIRQNSAIDYTEVSAYENEGGLEIWLNPADGQTAAYINYDAVEFNIMAD